MKGWHRIALCFPLLASCLHGTPKTSLEAVQPSLFLEGIEVEDPAGAKPLPSDSKLPPGQGFAVKLRTQGYVQVVEETAAGTTSFLVKADALTPAGSVRVPATGFLRSSASAQTVCVVVSSRPLVNPSCAEEEGRNEDRTPPSSPPPKEERATPPPPTRDDNSTRGKDLIRVVRRLPVGG